MPVLRKDGAALLFVHIPKTGGGSVETAFRKSGWAVDHFDGTSGPDSLNYLRLNSPQHADAAQIEATFRLERFGAVFAFVRDPLARIKSEYVWRHRVDESVDPSGRAFEKWLKANLRQTLANPWRYDNHFRPQVDFMVRGTRALRMEDGIDAGLSHLADVTELDVPRSAPRRHAGSNVSTVSPAEIEVTAKAAKLVSDFYAEDYRRFGYERADAA